MGEKTDYSVFCAGHSLMVGITGTAGREIKGEGFVGSVEAARVFGDMPKKLGIGIRMDVVARTGSGIAWSQARLDSKKKGQYDVVILYTGGNDLGVGRKETPEDAADRVIERLAKLYYTAAKTLGAKKVFMFLFLESADPKARDSPKETAARIVNDWLRRNIPQEDLIDLNKHPRLSELGKNWKEGSHPTPAGYQIMREIIRERFEEWHKKRAGTKAELPPRELARMTA